MNHANRKLYHLSQEEYDAHQAWNRRQTTRRYLALAAFLVLLLGSMGACTYQWGWSGNFVVPHGTVAAKETGAFGRCDITLVHETEPKEIVYSCPRDIYDSVEVGETIYYRFESNFWTQKRRIIQVGTEQELERSVWGS